MRVLRSEPYVLHVTLERATTTDERVTLRSLSAWLASGVRSADEMRRAAGDAGLAQQLGLERLSMETVSDAVGRLTITVDRPTTAVTMFVGSLSSRRPVELVLHVTPRFGTTEETTLRY